MTVAKLAGGVKRRKEVLFYKPMEVGIRLRRVLLEIGGVHLISNPEEGYELQFLGLP
jgi:hypothetical protein